MNTTQVSIKVEDPWQTCAHTNRNGKSCGLDAGHDGYHFTMYFAAKKPARNWDNPSMQYVWWADDGKRVTRAQREAAVKAS